MRKDGSLAWQCGHVFYYLLKMRLFCCKGGFPEGSLALFLGEMIIGLSGVHSLRWYLSLPLKKEREQYSHCSYQSVGETSFCWGQGSSIIILLPPHLQRIASGPLKQAYQISHFDCVLEFELRVGLVGSEHGEEVVGLEEPEDLEELLAGEGVLHGVLLGEVLDELVEVGGLPVLGLVGLQHHLHELSRLLHLLLEPRRTPRRYYVEVDEASRWVSGRSHGRRHHESDRGLHVGEGDLPGETHLGKGLAEANQGLELAGSGRDSLATDPERPHAEVIPDDLLACLLGEEGLDVLPRIGDVLGELVDREHPLPTQGKSYSCLRAGLSEQKSRMWVASSLSLTSFWMSSMRKMRSNLERREGGRLMFQTTDFLGSYLEWMGLAAARMAVREFSWQTMPAFAIEMVCCSIASSSTALEFSSILSNSSMQQIPWSLSTSAPLYKMNSCVYGSFLTLAVKPTALDPLPLVKMLLGAILQTCCSSCDLAVEGSPRRQTLMSDLNLPLQLFSRFFLVPPKSWQRMPFLMSWWPKMEGAKEWARSSIMVSESAIRLNYRLSSSLNTVFVPSTLYFFSSRIQQEIRSTQVLNTERILFFSRSTLAGQARYIPMSSTRSPGRNPSTLWSYPITVIEDGVYPSVTSSGSSWNLTYCLSVKVEKLCWTSKESLALQTSQVSGSLTLAFSRTRARVWEQTTHLKKADFISGQMSELRMTMPLRKTSLPIISGLRFLMERSSSWSRCLISTMSSPCLLRLRARVVWSVSGSMKCFSQSARMTSSKAQIISAGQKLNWRQSSLSNSLRCLPLTSQMRLSISSSSISCRRYTFSPTTSPSTQLATQNYTTNFYSLAIARLTFIVVPYMCSPSSPNASPWGCWPRMGVCRGWREGEGAKGERRGVSLKMDCESLIARKVQQCANRRFEIRNMGHHGSSVTC